MNRILRIVGHVELVSSCVDKQHRMERCTSPCHVCSHASGPWKVHVPKDRHRDETVLAGLSEVHHVAKRRTSSGSWPRSRSVYDMVLTFRQLSFELTLAILLGSERVGLEMIVISFRIPHQGMDVGSVFRFRQSCFHAEPQIQGYESIQDLIGIERHQCSNDFRDAYLDAGLAIDRTAQATKPGKRDKGQTRWVRAIATRRLNILLFSVMLSGFSTGNWFQSTWSSPGFRAVTVCWISLCLVAMGLELGLDRASIC